MKRKILIVDDDARLLETLRDTLKLEGYEVATATSAEQALTMLDSVRPGLIILDIMMPGMGGMGFLGKISEETGAPDYPVLVLTAKAPLAEMFGNIEVDGFLVKPVLPDALVQEVGRILFLRAGEGAGSDAPAPAEEEIPDTPAPADLSGKKLLVVDYDVPRTDLLVPVLETLGADVTTVRSEPAGLERMLLDKPDAVLLFAEMPQLSAVQTVSMLRQMTSLRELPVIVYGARGPAAKADVRTSWLEDDAPEAVVAALSRIG